MSSATEGTENTEIMNSLKNGFGLRHRRRSRYLLPILCVLCALCVSLSAQDFRTVHDGIEYAEVAREISGQQVKMNLLRLDLTKVRLDVVHAMDAAIGTEKTSSIATRHGAVAAINAGFFRLDNSIFAGDAAGLLMINGKLLSEGIPGRSSVWMSEVDGRTFVNFGKQILIGRVRINGEVRALSGIDRERKPGELLQFTPEFGPTTLTDDNGTEIVVERDRIRSINVNKGNSLIPKDGFVLSGSGNFAIDLRNFKAKQRIEFGIQLFNLESFKKGETRPNTKFPGYDIVGGIPLLIKDGQVDVTWEQEKTTRSFVETRHPRTAVAKLKDGKFLMITVDGRSESSGGIGLYDLANYLLELGATDAMNLDGGGSTTMFLDGKVVNHPSDKEGERKVSDAILVTLRSNGAVKK